MIIIKFYVIEYDKNDKRKFIDNSIILQTDPWDDQFKYITLFHAYFYKKGRKIKLGRVKIVDLDQLNGKMITKKSIPSEFSALPSNFYSLGQEIKYYRRFKMHCDKEQIDTMNCLYKLRDIATRNGLRRVISRYEDLFYGSLIRSSEAEKALEEAKFILGIIETNGKAFDINFATMISGADSEHLLNIDFEQKNIHLPYRINIIVGKNATGKTKVLSALAEEYSGIASFKKNLKSINRPSFSKYIAISFNAFDEFYFPHCEDDQSKFYGYINDLKNLSYKTKDKEIKEVLEDYEDLFEELDTGFTDYSSSIERNNSIFSYTYVGLRNSSGILSDNELKDSFIESYKILSGKRRRIKWISIIKEMFSDESPEVIRAIRKIKKVSINNMIDEFWGLLSSGQHVVISTLTSVIAHIEDESLLLIDEPETHLHPNSISMFMKTINKLLDEYNSYSIIATHSPQILQQVPSSNITLFLRDGNTPYTEKLEVETFGMDISSIISNVFEVSEKESCYKNTLRTLKEKGISKKNIENLFDYGLDFNARLYLSSIFEEN